ncbi:helix-turn-helix domain-containing protein [Allosalinactinospora lopnorensis]|uniref:helix-turn-helix domain-containing protein n=1 Tax=Allosalinactinospora lopnorensis TaxID=1352348 RepID=UPI000623EC8F|nr:helix-turn-helix transcriptional regulator [Allosalinactinospora lopnorensis]
MGSSSEIPVGECLKFYRTGQKKTQAVVAGLAGVSEDYLSQIERGLKSPTITLLHRFSRILGVPVSSLLGEPKIEQDGEVHPVASDINRALIMPPQSRGEVAPDDIESLKDRVNSAWQIWQNSPHRFTEGSDVLPALVEDVQAAARALEHADPEHRRAVNRVSADLYFLLRTFTKRIGRVDLSLLVADRGIQVAEAADDPLRVAGARWNLAHVLLAQDDADGAEDVVMHAAEGVRTELGDTTESVAMQGALWLTGAVASVRNGDHWTAHGRIREYAGPAAERAGEGNVMWTAFGPTNVQLHAVSIEMESGESAEALRLADTVDPTRTSSIERQTTFSLEVARSYEQRRDDAAVLIHLLNAEGTGPEDMKYNLLARDLVRGLNKRARPTFAPQVRALARRVGLYE